MPQKIKLILNPTANHERSIKIASDLRPLLAKYDADWSATEYPDHATELAHSAGEQGCDLVVAAGGDGTVHEVINGLMQVPEKIVRHWALFRSARGTISPISLVFLMIRPRHCNRVSPASLIRSIWVP